MATPATDRSMADQGHLEDVEEVLVKTMRFALPFLVVLMVVTTVTMAVALYNGDNYAGMTAAILAVLISVVGETFRAINSKIRR